MRASNSSSVKTSTVRRSLRTLPLLLVKRGAPLRNRNCRTALNISGIFSLRSTGRARITALENSLFRIQKLMRGRGFTAASLRLGRLTVSAESTTPHWKSRQGID